MDGETNQGVADAVVVALLTHRVGTGESSRFQTLNESRHVSDADGNYSFEISAEYAALRSLQLSVCVESPGRAPWCGAARTLAEIQEMEALGHRHPFERLEMWPTANVVGRMLDPEGRPVAGVRVLGFSNATLVDFGGAQAFAGRRLAHATTDVDGRFELKLSKRGAAGLNAWPDDFAPIGLVLETLPGDVGTIRLAKGIRPRGRVVDGRGRGVADARLSIFRVGYAGGLDRDLSGAAANRDATTDAEGRFRFAPLPPGDYVVRVELSPSRVAEVGGVFTPRRLTLRDGVEPEPLEWKPSDAVVFRARLRDASGRPETGSLSVFGRIGGDDWSVTSTADAEGVVAVSLPRDLEDVRFSPHASDPFSEPAWRRRRASGGPLERHPDEIENWFRPDARRPKLPDDLEEWEFVRHDAPIVTIAAVDEDDRPIVGFRASAVYTPRRRRIDAPDVHIPVDWPAGATYSLPAESDVGFASLNNGRVRTTGLTPDEAATFVVSAPGYEPSSRTVKLREGERREERFLLKAKPQ